MSWLAEGNFGDAWECKACITTFFKDLGAGLPEPGISGLEKTAPSGELEFSSRSN